MVDDSLVRRARERLDAVVAAMRAAGLWDVARPDDSAFADMGPFGQRTMAFAQWLRFVFAPNVEALVAAGGPFPKGSSVAVIAAREGDTDPAVASLVPALSAFDALFEEDDGDPDAVATPPAPRPVSPGPPPPTAPATPALRRYADARRRLDAGDRAGALEAIEAALADDPDLRDAHNLHGWILVSEPASSFPRLEAGVAAFREERRRHPDVPEALVNLCDTLVRLGRADEAVAEARASVDDPEPTGGVAFNWLGWRLLRAGTDPAGAEADLREATRRRPRWGTPWQNLGRLLEGQGRLGEAYHAFGEAVACGDTYDDATARDHLLALHLTLAAQGEKPPRGSQPPAPADLTAVALLEALGRDHQAVAAGLSFGIRPAQRVPAGAVPFSLVFTTEGDRNHVLAILDDLRVLQSVAVQARHAGGLVVREVQVDAENPTEGVARAAGAIAAWLEDPASRDPEAVTPFDAGLHVQAMLARAVPRPGGWRLAAGEDPTGGDRAATTVVSEHGGPLDLAIEVEARPDGGVVLQGLPGGFGAEPPVYVATRPADLEALTPTLVADTRRALAAWEAYRDRDFGAPRLARRIAAALADGDGGRWDSEARDGSYPRRHAEAFVRHRGRVDRFVVRVTEDTDGCLVEVHGAAQRVRTWEDLEGALPAIAEAAHADLERFCVDDLVVGDVLRVREAFRGFDAGERVRVADHRYDPHGGDAWRLAGSHDRTVWLDVMFDRDLEILEQLDRYLEPA